MFSPKVDEGQKTVFMPFESANVLGAVGSLKEMLGSIGGPGTS